MTAILPQDMPANKRGWLEFFTKLHGMLGTVADGSSDLSTRIAQLEATRFARNAVINGNFDIWQRASSFAAAAGVIRYTADRWRTGSQGTTIAVSRTAFALGQTAVPGEPTWNLITTVASVAGAGNYAALVHVVEGVRTFAGQTATLSFWAWADAARPMSVDLAQGFGTGGSPSTGITAIGVTKFNLTTTPTRFTVTVAFPSIAGKTLGSNGDDGLSIVFWFDAGASFNARTASLGQQSGSFGVSGVQLELGSVATPFEQRHIGDTLALCQRYYEQGQSLYTGNITTGFAYNLTVPFAVEKRGTPVVTPTDAGNNGFAAGGFTLAYDAPATRQFRIYKVSNATISAGFYLFTWTADAEI